MNRIEQYNATSRQHRSAFTLVEMMVSMALILLIMSMFAGIFTLATDTVKTQRGIAENDQVARSLVTMFRSDLAKRTMRTVFPYYPTEDPATSPTPFGTRAGYFYVSTNNPDSSHDDLIQFTVDARLLQQSPDNTEYFGAAQLLHDVISGADVQLRGHPNQPEADDGDLNPNGVSASNVAEIAIFMRNGKLYRRVSLLREPLSVAGEELDVQPHSNFTGPPANPPLLIDLNDPAAVGGQVGGAFHFRLPDGTLTTSDDFWRYFDFSAHPVSTDGPPNLNRPTNGQFVGIDALNNESSSGLGIPHNRFGFNPLTGQSREHDNLTTRRFLGRWLQAETSHSGFNWPMAPADPAVFASGTNGNPMDIAPTPFGTPVNLALGQDIVSELQIDSVLSSTRGGARGMEDLLLANVHEFRVELWDEALQRFVVPGYGAVSDVDAAVGDFHIRRNLQFDGTAVRYGPLALPPANIAPHVFDTWHSEVTQDFNNSGGLENSDTQPPFIPYRFYPPRGDDNPPGPRPNSPFAPPQVQPTGTGAIVSFWSEVSTYRVGDVVFARSSTAAPGWDADGNPGSFDWIADAAAVPKQAFQIAYQCVAITTGLPTGSPGASPPTWPLTPGRRIADNEVVWLAIDNRRPLSAIRLTIRFQSGASENIRQVSQILPLLD